MTKPTPAKKSAPKTAKPAVRKPVAKAEITTPVRYSALPKMTIAKAPAAITAEQVAAKAFELFAAGRPGGEMDHWLAAEAELRQAA